MRRPIDQKGSLSKKRPGFQDRLVVFLLSLAVFLLVIALGLRAEPMVELVLLLVATSAVATINVLFPFSTWDEPRTQEMEGAEKSKSDEE